MPRMSCASAGRLRGDVAVEHDPCCLVDLELGSLDEVREVRLEERQVPVPVGVVGQWARLRAAVAQRVDEHLETTDTLLVDWSARPSCQYSTEGFGSYAVLIVAKSMGRRVECPQPFDDRRCRDRVSAGCCLPRSPGVLTGTSSGVLNLVK